MWFLLWSIPNKHVHIRETWFLGWGISATLGHIECIFEWYSDQLFLPTWYYTLCMHFTIMTWLKTELKHFCLGEKRAHIYKRHWMILDWLYRQTTCLLHSLFIAVLIWRSECPLKRSAWPMLTEHMSNLSLHCFTLMLKLNAHSTNYKMAKTNITHEIFSLKGLDALGQSCILQFKLVSH